jgi:hypothetical protein
MQTSNISGSFDSMQASREWASRPADQRFQTLAELSAKVKGRRMRSRSVDLDSDRVSFAERGDGSLVINHAISACTPSHWAFGQIAGLIGAPAAYLRKLPTDLLVDNLNHGIRNTPREAVKFMTQAAENTDVSNLDPLNTLQAVTSTKYGRIWDADVVDGVARLVERSGGKFYNPKAYSAGQFSGTTTAPAGLYASDRDVFMFMIDGGSRLDVGPRAQLNRGFIVKNSEVGAATFSLTTFLFNECCGNHIIYGARDVNQLLIRHTAGGPSRFDLEATPVLNRYMESSAITEETTIRAAMAKALPSADDDRLSFAAKFNITRAELKSAVDFAKAEEGQCATVWDLVQGLTAYARGFDYLDARVDLETRAGKILRSVETAAN